MTWITAHSGADGTLDNSIEFLQYAGSTQVDALEIDIRKDKKGILQLSHDKAEAKTVELSDAFQIVARYPKIKVNCDLKEAGLELPVYMLAEQCQLAERLFFSGCVSPKHMRLLPDEMKSRVFWNIEQQIPALYERCRQDSKYAVTAAEEMCIRCMQAEFSVINAYEKMVSDLFLEVVNRYQIQLSVWTVNEKERMAYFLSRGVKNITTRRVALAATMKRKGRTG